MKTTAYELVQPILVSAAGTHEDTVRAAAEAASRAWLSTADDPMWDVWFSQAFAKTVRRVKQAQLLKLPEAAARVEEGDSIAFAYTPMLYSEFPTVLAKAQVQGTDFARSGWETFAPHMLDDSAVCLVLNPAVADAMSTGKTAAQAAHALMLHVMLMPESDRFVPDFMVVVAADSGVFNELAADAPVAVRDAGRTEIEPGTVTFIVPDRGC